MPAQKDGEGQEEENNEVRPPEQEEEEEVVEEGAKPRRPLLPVLCHAVACALHPTARWLIFRYVRPRWAQPAWKQKLKMVFPFAFPE